MKIKCIVKTSHGKKFTHQELKRIIDKALWGQSEFRGVDIYEFISDADDVKEVLLRIN